MEWLIQIIRLILMCSVWTACSSDTPCPTESGCFCFEGYLSCSGSTSYPAFVPNGTTHIALFSINADEIPKGTMDNIPYLESYELYQSRIKVIKRDAFSNIKIKTFSLYNIDVGEIEGFAFNNLSNIESFSIYGMTVKTIHSYAFSNIYNVQTWGMSSVDLSTVETYSFYNFSVGSFQLFNSVVGDMKRGAIAHVNKIGDYELHTNEFGVLECGTVEPLLRLANISSFYENIFQCDCKMAWMLRDENVRGYLFANWCEMPNTKEKISLENFDIDQLECDFAEDGCDVSQFTSQVMMTSTDSVDITSTHNNVKTDKTMYISEETVKVTKYGKTAEPVSMSTKAVSRETELVSMETTTQGGRKITESVTNSSPLGEITTVNGYTKGEKTTIKTMDTTKIMKSDTTVNNMNTTPKNKVTKQAQKTTNQPKQVNMNTKDNGSVKMLPSVCVFVISLTLFNFVL